VSVTTTTDNGTTLNDKMLINAAVMKELKASKMLVEVEKEYVMKERKELHEKAKALALEKDMFRHTLSKLAENQMMIEKKKVKQLKYLLLRCIKKRIYQ
jgi:hypothetical protein